MMVVMIILRMIYMMGREIMVIKVIILLGRILQILAKWGSTLTPTHASYLRLSSRL